MSDEAAFAAAVAANPDDDLPRLVFADWLDDHDQPDRAEFVRAQVQCAATPAWEPFAVYCRHRRPEWTTGDPWRTSLPWVQGWAVEWHPDRAFRRGFGHSLLIRDMTAFLADAPRLFDAAPIGELHLPTATLDQWRSFGRAKWLPRVKSVHLYGTTTPIEPVRVLCESPLATGIEEIVFEVCSRPGMPVLLEELFESELGKRLKRMTLKQGPLGSDRDDLTRVLCDLPLGRITDLRIENVSCDIDLAYQFAHTYLIDGLDSLVLRDYPTSGYFVDGLCQWEAECNLRSLNIAGSTISPDMFDLIANTGKLQQLRRIELAENSNGLHFEFGELTRDSEHLVGLRSAGLAKSNIGDHTVEMTVPSTFWFSLTELDLRGNRITDAGAKHLLAAPVPPDLTALLLGGNPISDDMRTKLRRHFGPAVLFDE